MRSIRIGRRGLISLLSVAGLILLLLFVVGPMVGRGILRDKLQLLISEQLNATLEMGGLAYIPPYGARVTDAKLTARDAAGNPVELFSAKSIELKLAKLPLGSGPLVIKALNIDTPSIRLVREEGGIVGRGAPITAIATTQPTEESRQKLSEIFELRKVKITDGSFVYEDQTDKSSVPLAWGGLTLDVNTQPTSAAEYGFQFQASSGDVATLDSKGSFNIDDLLLRLEKSRIAAQVEAGRSDSPLPGEIQKLLKEYEISGALTVESSGEVPLMRPTDGKLTSVIELRDGRGRLPGATAPLDKVSFKITCSAEPLNKTASGQGDEAPLPLMRAQVEHLDALGAGASVSATAKVNADDVMLRVEELKVHARLDSQSKSSILPPELLAPLQELSLGGEAIVQLSGEGPIDDPTRGTLSASTIELKEATARLPNAGASLANVNLKMQCAASPATHPAYVAGYPVPIVKASIEHFSGGGPGAKVSGAADIQTDEHTVRVARGRLDATVDPAVQPSALPPDVITKLLDHAASGSATIQLDGEAPLNDLASARGNAGVVLQNVRGRIPDATADLEDVSLKMQCAFEPAANPMMVQGVALPIAKADIEQFSVRGPGAAVSGAIKFEADESTLRVEHGSIDATIDPASQTSILPPAALEPLREYAASGKAHVTFAGETPLATPRRAKLVSTIALNDASALIPGASGPLENVNLKVDVTTVPSTQPAGDVEPLPQLLKLTFDHLHAGGAGTMIDITGGTIVLNGDNRACGITDLKLAAQVSDDRSILPAKIVEALKPYGMSGKVLVTLNGSGPIPESMAAIKLAQADLLISNDQLRIMLTDFPEPVHDVADITGRLADGVLTLKTIRALYGEDRFFVREAEIPVESLPDRLDIRRFEGAAVFANKVPNYSKQIADIMALARPRDMFEFTGSASLDLVNEGAAARHDYHVRIQSGERAAISALSGRVPMLNLITDIVLTPEAIQLNRLEANVMNGKAVVLGRVTPGDPMTYIAELRLRDIDLNTAASLLAKPGEEPLVVSGDLDGVIKVEGAGVDESAIDNLRTTEPAQFNIVHGDLYKIPVLKDIVARIQLRNAATVGDAQVRVSIKDGVITLHNADVAAPALGVSGEGTIGFDGKLKITGVADPIGSWGDRVDIGAIEGLRDAMKKTSKELLYNVVVGGTIEEPDVRVTRGELLSGSGRK